MEKAKVVGYCRVSTLDQAKEGISLDAQLAKIKAYCEMNDFELVEIFIESGVSGGKPLSERPQGSRMLARLEQGDIKGVIGWDISRVWRSTLDCLKCVEDWQNRGINLHLVSMQIRTDSALGKMFLTILASVATCEREQISERTRMAMRHLKSTGKVYGHVPLGFQRIGKDLVVDLKEMDTVRLIHRRHKEGKSMASTARYLNEQDIPTKNNKTWHHTAIRLILKNDIYEPYLD